MTLMAAVIPVVFTLLVILCVEIFGLLGLVVWLCIYGLFVGACRMLMSITGDPNDVYDIERQPIRPRRRR